jgi:hypothetical protein
MLTMPPRFSHVVSMDYLRRNNQIETQPRDQRIKDRKCIMPCLVTHTRIEADFETPQSIHVFILD